MSLRLNFQWLGVCPYREIEWGNSLAIRSLARTKKITGDTMVHGFFTALVTWHKCDYAHLDNSLYCFARQRSSCFGQVSSIGSAPSLSAWHAADSNNTYGTLVGAPSLCTPYVHDPSLFVCTVSCSTDVKENP